MMCKAPGCTGGFRSHLPIITELALISAVTACVQNYGVGNNG